ncbi:type IV secretion system protein VirB3 [Enhydrobacter aerosaccus]|uniref:Type IV secretion system protein VirB3 n=1 Tax=Enhydrobacter aerosaccus TaxID=225324 RepID=A0A1T4TJA6_9HYPH|nr:VirB3 family type IV secretion system protein [Enhydrobacter aerosaccus]SKA40388.1 type IV secretion system protein VirB3 [Enhydrobacter aerosaccus]
MTTPGKEPLFLAITRPALYGGVPSEAAVACLMLGVVGSMIVAGTMILFFPISVVFYGIARLVSARDPLIFAVFFAWLRSQPRGRVFGLHTSTKWWGGVSMSPLSADINERKPGRG